MQTTMNCLKYFTLRVVREVAMFTFANTKDKRIREYGEACFVKGVMWAKAKIEEELLKEQNIKSLTKDLNPN